MKKYIELEVGEYFLWDDHGPRDPLLQRVTGGHIRADGAHGLQAVKPHVDMWHRRVVVVRPVKM